MTTFWVRFPDDGTCIFGPACWGVKVLAHLLSHCLPSPLELPRPPQPLTSKANERELPVLSHIAPLPFSLVMCRGVRVPLEGKNRTRSNRNPEFCHLLWGHLCKWAYSTVHAISLSLLFNKVHFQKIELYCMVILKPLQSCKQLKFKNTCNNRGTEIS